MRYLKTKNFILAVPVVLLGFFFIASCATRQRTAPPITLTPPTPANGAQITPGPNDPRIGYVAARLMEQYHYSHRPMDAEMSKRFFDSYLDSLDSRHENFLQSDIAEFSSYRTNLDRLTVGGPDGVANLDAAFRIHNRYLERLRQHNDYVSALLKQDHFKFNTDERITIDRRHEAYPKDLTEAEGLWSQQLRFEYLMEKLSQEITVTNGTLVIKLPKTAGTNIIDTLTRRYLRTEHMYTNWDSTDVLQAYLNGMTHAYDPHSDYFNPEHEADFNIQMNLALFGIGAQLSESDGFCTIMKLIVGGPADKSKKLKENDRVVAVAQGTNTPVNVVGMELGKVVQLIRGAKGTEVRLTISPAEDRAARTIIALVRDEIKLDDQAARAKLIEIPNGKGGVTRLGVIDLPSFYAPVGGDMANRNGRATPKYTSVDVAKLLTKLKEEKVDGIILDLRNNPGGSLEEAVKFTSLFIKDGPVVQARSDEGVSVDSDTDHNQVYDGPLAVMINRFSASASEIVAAALQDYDRAIIVGDSSTFGKGTVQSLYPLHPFVWPATASATNDPGELKVTIRKFYRINGGSTQFKGVASDIILPDPLDYRTDIESESTLDYPLAWDTIHSAAYTKFNLVQPYLSELSKQSLARTATNPEFGYLRQDIQETKKLNADRTLTLNENQAIQERRTNQAKQKARDTERDARQPLKLTVYDLSLTNTIMPGLPNPSYYFGMLETNSASSTAANHQLAVVRYDFIKDGTTNSIFTTNSLPKDSGTNGLFTIDTVKVKNQPDLDPLLLETDNIMLDYISLLSQPGTLSKN